MLASICKTSQRIPSLIWAVGTFATRFSMPVIYQWRVNVFFSRVTASNFSKLTSGPIPPSSLNLNGEVFSLTKSALLPAFKHTASAEV